MVNGEADQGERRLIRSIINKVINTITVVFWPAGSSSRLICAAGRSKLDIRGCNGSGSIGHFTAQFGF